MRFDEERFYDLQLNKPRQDSKPSIITKLATYILDRRKICTVKNTKNPSKQASQSVEQ
jgi:hypothetical protein